MTDIRPFRLPEKPSGRVIFKVNPATWDSHSVNTACQYVEQIACYLRQGKAVVIDFNQCFGMTEAFMKELITSLLNLLKDRIFEFISISATEPETQKVITKALVSMSTGSKRTYRNARS